MKIDLLVLIAGISLTFIVIGYWRPVLAFYLSASVAPWQDLMVDPGLRLTLFTLSMLGLMAAVVSNWKERWRPILTSRIWWPLIALVAWASCWSLVQIPATPNTQVAGGVLRSPAIRPLVQVLSFCLMLLPVVAAPFVLNRVEQLARLTICYLISLMLLLVIGWWQLVVGDLTGHNPLPMGAVNAWLGGMGTLPRDAVDLGYGGRIMYRMSSLGGEPRWLSQSIATALLLLQIFWSTRLLRFSGVSILVYIFFVASLIATQSMSGLYLWLLGGVILIVHRYFSRRHAKRVVISRPVLISGSVILVALCGAWWLFNSAAPPDTKVGGYLWYVLQRVAMRGLIADFDAIVLSYLSAEPWKAIFGVGLGNIHLYANAYMDEYFKDFAAGTSFVADSGWLRMVSELGVVGLLLFLWWCRRFMQTLRLPVVNTQWAQLSPALTPVFVIAVVGYLARGTGYAPIAFLLLGACMVQIFSTEKGA